MVLEAAKEDGLISINPAKSKRLRNPSTKKTERQALTSAEADDIEAHLQDIPQLRDRRYVAMLLKFPARCEDIKGLQVKDFGFDIYPKMIIKSQNPPAHSSSVFK